jgi:hypothetical protein
MLTANLSPMTKVSRRMDGGSTKSFVSGVGDVNAVRSAIAMGNIPTHNITRITRVFLLSFILLPNYYLLGFGF